MKCISVQTPGLGPAHSGIVLAQGRTLDADLAALPYGGDRWTLRAQDHALGLAQTPSVFTISNGYMDVRGPSDPSGAQRVYLNGVFEETPIHYHEAAHGFSRASDTRMAVADATRIEMVVDGEPATVAALELDFRCECCARHEGGWRHRACGDARFDAANGRRRVSCDA